MPPRIPKKPFVCQSCRKQNSNVQRLQQRHLTTGTACEPSPTPKQAVKYAQLKRSAVLLTGPDAATFLHNLLPGKVLDLRGATNPIYTTFLSAQGRILYDVMLYPPTDRHGEESWKIDVDDNSLPALMKHLKKHKLRSKFNLEHLDRNSATVYHAWPAIDDETLRAGNQVTLDPRPGMGTRWSDNEVLNSPRGTWLRENGAEQVAEEEYAAHRMLNGIAEGQSEIFSEHALPQESNIDLFGGIDFMKGCYLGQELTIRTHHTGVVRKRILPCQLYESSEPPLPQEQQSPKYRKDVAVVQPPPGSNISKLNAKGRSRSSGKWLGGVGNIGLALCRLEMMTDIQLTAERTSYDPSEQYKVQWEEDGEQREVMLKPFVPRWLREGVEANLRRKDRKKPKQEEEEEEDEVD